MLFVAQSFQILNYGCTIAVLIPNYLIILLINFKEENKYTQIIIFHLAIFFALYLYP